MNTKLKEALLRVALTSQSASELVDKVMANQPSEEATILKNQVESLKSQVMELQLQVASQDVEFSESDATQLYEAFRGRLREANAQLLVHSYGRAFFLPLSKPVRKIMAKALLDETDARSLPSQTLWVTVFSSGEIQ